MYEKMKDDYKIAFIRGATTATGNSFKEIFFVFFIIGCKSYRFNKVYPNFKEENCSLRLTSICP